MSLFQRNPFEKTDSKSLYTLGLNKSVLIVGLGNIGKEYDSTRHNIGFDCIDSLAAAHNIEGWLTKKDLKCRLVMGSIGSVRVILIKPTTMMNLSGHAVQAVQQFYKIGNADTVVVHDELDVTFGTIRCRIGGGSAGNNGIKSISESIGEDYGRLRIGIGPKTPEQMDSADFVLAKFSKDEQALLGDLKREATALITEYIASGQLPHDTRKFII